MGVLKGFAPLSISTSPLFTLLVLWPTRWLDTLVRVELNKNRATALSAWQAIPATLELLRDSSVDGCFLLALATDAALAYFYVGQWKLCYHTLSVAYENTIIWEIFALKLLCVNYRTGYKDKIQTRARTRTWQNKGQDTVQEQDKIQDEIQIQNKNKNRQKSLWSLYSTVMMTNCYYFTTKCTLIKEQLCYNK